MASCLVEQKCILQTIVRIRRPRQPVARRRISAVAAVPSGQVILEAASSTSGSNLMCDSSSSLSSFKGWLDDKLVARLRLVQSIAADRREMHAALAQQRDGWNKLFQSTLGLATISAAILVSSHGPAGATCAALLDASAALVMAAVNTFQPSQLAEEQRTASRLFALIGEEIESCLAIDLRFREHASSFLDDKVRRLHTLDAAFPLPLTPGGLPKFPDHVEPSQLGTCYDASRPVKLMAPFSPQINGWSSQLEEDLLRISRMLKEKDVPNYVGMGRVILKANKALAIAAPAMAMLAAAAALGGAPPLATGVASIAAFFARSLSHDMQLGMVFEMYRNCAGYYALVDASIQRTLRMPDWKKRRAPCSAAGRSKCGNHLLIVYNSFENQPLNWTVQEELPSFSLEKN